jgi:16S rRNA (adenine1518-N6/adenine1519-N6)-dimethyltransferase
MPDLPATKKSLGQHWLSDDASLTSMVVAADVQADDVVVEIGPGGGTLTQKLLDTGAQVVAVEFDESLIPGLQAKFAEVPQLKIVQRDILRFDFTALPPNYKVAANIPYYLTSNLLRVMCETPNHFSAAALLVQKEVAERVAAQPGDMSLLSVSVQFYCEVTLGRVVPANLFIPPPKVDSQILMLSYHPEPLFPGVDEQEFFRIVKAGFSERRKKLRSSLSGGLRISKLEATELLVHADINPDLRAQALSLEDWHRLHQSFHSL